VISILKKGLIGILFIFFITSTVWAENVYFRLDESKIRLSIAPGNSQAGAIKVYSQSEEEIKLRVYLEDWEYTDKQDGSKNFFPTQSTPLSAAGWISFSPAEFTLSPGEEKRLNYIVNLPQEATGGYYAVMFFETLFEPPAQLAYTEEEIRTSATLAVRIGTLFYIEAEGTVERQAGLRNLSVSRDKEDKSLSISLDLQNTGNADIAAGGTFNIIDGQGRVYARGEFNDVGTLPGDSAILTSKWGESLPRGIYDLILTINLGKRAEGSVGRVPVITREAQIEIGADGRVIRVGDLR
jgi:hypothetical protein